jgi:hypothetical protein
MKSLSEAPEKPEVEVHQDEDGGLTCPWCKRKYNFKVWILIKQYPPWFCECGSRHY